MKQNKGGKKSLQTTQKVLGFEIRRAIDLRMAPPSHTLPPRLTPPFTTSSCAARAFRHPPRPTQEGQPACSDHHAPKALLLRFSEAIDTL